jgi:hypothetical protein
MIAQQQLLNAIRDVYKAENALTSLVKTALPIGTHVEWLHGDHIRTGIVKHHCYNGDVIVEMPTGRSVRRDVRSLVDRMPKAGQP